MLVGAMAEVQQLILAQPTNAIAQIAAADLLDLAGYPELALLQGGAALDAYDQANPNATEAPSNLLSNYQRYLTLVTTPGPASPTTTLATGGNTTFSSAGQSVTLSAVVSTANGTVDGGTVTFTVTGVGSPLTSAPVVQGNASVTFTVPAGTTAGAYPLLASYNGTDLFSTSNDTTQTFTITKATPSISWTNPASVTAGTKLGSSQLNVTASVPGVFAFNPPAGTLLLANPALMLSANFTPRDSVDYNSATASVFVDVPPLPGDVNGDGVVNCADIAIVKASFGKKTGQPGFDPRADINHDGIVNIIDLAMAAHQLPAGTTCP
jgi:hypothetical protein